MKSGQCKNDERRFAIGAVALAVSIALSGCGGSGVGASSSSEAATAVVTNTVSGAVVKGPVSGATVCAYALVATGKGDKLACTTSNADGSYDLALSSSGPVLIEATGGTYTDEATGTLNVSLTETLRVVGTAGQGPQSLVPTPLTELAVRQALASGGLTPETFKAAAAKVGAAFGLGQDADLLNTTPAVTGQVNPYGSALIGLSKMLAKGATLGGLLANGDLDALKAGYQTAISSVCNLPKAQNLSVVAPSPIDFTVLAPRADWRSLLPSSGAAMGCNVTANSASEVRLTCPASALTPGLTITTKSDAAAVAALPLAGVLIVGSGVAVGGITASPNTIVFSDSVMLPPINQVVLDTNPAATVNLGGAANVNANGNITPGGAHTATSIGTGSNITINAGVGLNAGNVTFQTGNLTLGGGPVIGPGKLKGTDLCGLGPNGAASALDHIPLVNWQSFLVTGSLASLTQTPSGVSNVVPQAGTLVSTGGNLTVCPTSLGSGCGGAVSQTPQLTVTSTSQ